MIRRRPVETVLHVVFASPENHDGLARGLCGYLRRFHDEIGLVTAAEAATHQRGIHDYLFGRQLGSFSDDALRPLRRLRGHPSFRAVGANLHRAVHRLHASVGSEREFIDCFDFFRTGGQSGVGIAVVTQDFSRLGGVREEFFLKLCRRFLHRGAFVPFHFESVAALDRGPGIVSENGDSAGS